MGAHTYIQYTRKLLGVSNCIEKILHFLLAQKIKNLSQLLN